ncbi:MAG: hypothetical protein QXI12_12460 [Candidatus Methanomethyliaceae archaeon]
MSDGLKMSPRVIANEAAHELLSGRRVDSVIAEVANNNNMSTLELVRLIKRQLPAVYAEFLKDLRRIEAEGPDFPLPAREFQAEYYRYRVKELQLRLAECQAKLAAAKNILKEFEGIKENKE